MYHKEFQPLRIYSDWKVNFNRFYAIEDINEETFHLIEGPLISSFYSEFRNQTVELEWLPEHDVNGCYIIEVYNTREVFNPKTNTQDVIIDEEPHTVFKSRKTKEIANKLEDLMWFLTPYDDLRILQSRGVVDEPSESYRIELKDKGLTQELVDKILNNGNKQIQILTLDHKDITKEIINRFVTEGCTVKVKKKAQYKLKNKKFR